MQYKKADISRKVAVPGPGEGKRGPEGHLGYLVRQANVAVRQAMDRALAELNARWGAAGLPELRMGIGVHTGEVFVGNIGGSARVKYTVVGDPVNLASRVEGLNKELGTTILITAETHALVADIVELKDRGRMSVKGRVQPVHVFELLAVR